MERWQVTPQNVDGADMAQSSGHRYAAVVERSSLAMTAGDVLTSADLLRAVKAAFAADTGKLEVLDDEEVFGAG